jgi:hypothetical protein
VGKYAIGILIGIVALVIYIFAYHKPQLKQEYQNGYYAGIASVGVAPPDTVTIIDTVKPPPIYIKTKPIPGPPGTASKIIIDTLVKFKEADIYVYSDDIASGIYIEPIFYHTTISIKDTVIKILSYEIEKPVPWYDSFEFGVVIGGGVVALLAYVFTAH